jgi:hypothetical protein
MPTAAGTPHRPPLFYAHYASVVFTSNRTDLAPDDTRSAANGAQGDDFRTFLNDIVAAVPQFDHRTAFSV